MLKSIILAVVVAVSLSGCIMLPDGGPHGGGFHGGPMHGPVMHHM